MGIPVSYSSKPGSTAKYRFSIDLRGVNSATVPITWPMPHIESELMDFQCSTSFAVIGFVSGYWQLPLDEDAQEKHSILTPDGVYSPTRTLQAACNSVANIQAKMHPLFAAEIGNLKAWWNEFILYANSEQLLIQFLRVFLKFVVSVICSFLQRR